MVRFTVDHDVDGRDVLNRLGHGGSEGRRSGSEEDEYLKSLKTQRAGSQRLVRVHSHSP